MHACQFLICSSTFANLLTRAQLPIPPPTLHDFASRSRDLPSCYPPANSPGWAVNQEQIAGRVQVIEKYGPFKPDSKREETSPTLSLSLTQLLLVAMVSDACSMLCVLARSS